MSTLHAPNSGYGFEAKQYQYRQKHWYWVDDQLSNRVPKSRRVVAFLDTKEAIETQYLLSLGYRPENLHAINCNPAEVALLTIRLSVLGLPKVRTHGIDYVRTLREARVSRWHIMSFDGCGPIASPNTLRCIKQMCDLASGGTIVSANVLAGRDAGWSASMLKHVKANGDSTHRRRWQWLQRAFTTRIVDNKIREVWSVAALKRGFYVSASGQPFLWLAIRLGLPHPAGFYGDMDASMREHMGAPMPLSLLSTTKGRAAMAQCAKKRDDCVSSLKALKDNVDAVERHQNSIFIAPTHLDG